MAPSENTQRKTEQDYALMMGSKPVNEQAQNTTEIVDEHQIDVLFGKIEETLRKLLQYELD